MPLNIMDRFISGLVLGAGASQRLGQAKQLLPFQGTTLLGSVVAQAESAIELDEIVVVLGRDADEIRKRVDFGPIAKVVENPAFRDGCASSYQAGISALNPTSDALMIILGDQPRVTSLVIDRLAAEWYRQRSEIALCSWQGRRGHPIIFARSMFDQLKELHGDKAAWKLVDAKSDLVQVVEIDFPLEDINTWSDFEQLESSESH